MTSEHLIWSLARPAAGLLAALLVGCGGGGGGGETAAVGAAAATTGTSGTSGTSSDTVVPGTPPASPASPAVVTANVDNGATNVPTGTVGSNNGVTGVALSATFSQPMDASTLNSAPAGTLLTYTLKDAAGNNVAGTVDMNSARTVATFTPSAPLAANTNFTATITTAAKSAAGVALSAPVAWSFKTQPAASNVRAAVNLGASGSFAILSKTGITDVFASVINGDVGSSPISGSAIGLTCGEVKTGKVYSVDAAGPLPCTVTSPTLLTSAVGAMETAYTDAAGRTLPDFTELGAGEVGGLTLVPGLYKWGTGVLISRNVTLSGGPNDVWIFQVAGTLNQASATRVTLAGGALAKNVFWQVAGGVAIGTTAHFEGVLLAKTMIAVKTGASVNGRLLAQTAVTLEQNAVTQPAP